MVSKKIAVIFVCVFCATLIVQAPAALLGPLVRQASHGIVELSNPAGTLWSGSATPMLNLKQGVSFPLEHMDWRISFGPMPSGNILVKLQESASPQKPPSEIYIGARQVELRNTSFELPAASLGALNPLLQGMGFQGLVQVSADKLVLQYSGAINGKAAANWRMAGSALSPVNPFGSYHFDLSGMGDRIQFSLNTLSGDLQLNGQGEWLTSNKLSFQTTARAVGAGKDVFAEMLRHLGPEIEPGVFSFRIGP